MSRKQTIFRLPKSIENPYVRVDKQFIGVPGLSFRAKGVLLYILSKPDHWKVNVKDIASHSKDGRDAVYASLKELMEYGYVQRVCHREKGKIMQYEYIVTEQAVNHREGTYSASGYPKEESCTQDHMENPETVSPQAEGAGGASFVSRDPETESRPLFSRGTPLQEEPHPAKPTVVKNDWSNELEKNKTCSGGACSTILDLWREIFLTKLHPTEYDALQKVCSRTTLVRNLCLIQEHHCVSSILAPFAFVMKCVTSGGYKVPKKAVFSVREEGNKKSNPLPKAVQRKRDKVPRESLYTSEELEEKKALLKEKI